MKKSLKFYFNKETDILYIDKVKPNKKQITEELGDDVIARINPKTKEIESLEVLFFSTRLLKNEIFELPIDASMFKQKVA